MILFLLAANTKGRWWLGVRSIEEARSADLVRVAEGEGVALEVRNGRYWGLCPFHNEKTPSFTINTEANTFYCFGCGAHGDAIDFVRKIRPELERFDAAVEWLAAQERAAAPPETASEEVVAAVDVGLLRACVSRVADAYARALVAPENGAARLYLRSRGVSARTAGAFGVGVASQSVDGDATTLEAAGLVFPGTRRDRLAGRLVLPIRDARGDTLGFGSRSLSPDDARPKYVNSPTTPIFAKRDALFGLDLAAPHIREADEVVLVEGYFDVLALHDVGLRNVVGVLGTGVGFSQIEKAARFCDSRRVVLALDADKAGIEAVSRLCTHVIPSLADRAGLDVRVARVVGFKDASDFVFDRKVVRGITPDDDIRDEFQRIVVDAAIPWHKHNHLTAFHHGDAKVIPDLAAASSSFLERR
ncbi:hypothetical protein CTAYLR_004173 [Chrysophaeum taylorii]|uniref:Toprim domain-containing protein n=1 Tax=Chrysophaeum taylorii TaxID=2483200 RepID=A0AAD7UMQ5_9STRA|nr:hypothetical protein CTAYLR_004173 [Chrysophaeum taylorii]